MWQIIKTAIIEMLWPILRDLVIQLAKELSAWIVEKFREWANNRNNTNADEAEAKAEEYQRKAETAESPKDAEINSRVAEVWREVAEKFRAENELLASELKRLKTQANSKAEKTMNNLDFDDAIEEKDGQLALKSNETSLLK